METVRECLGIVINVLSSGTGLLLFIAPIYVVFWVLSMVSGNKQTVISNIIGIVCTVGSMWWYNKIIVHMPVPQWFDIVGQMIQFSLGIYFLIYMLTMLGREIKDIKDKKKSKQDK